jgi:hypothetical protein
MDCTGILLALKLCTPPEPPADALAIAAEQASAQCLTKSQARAIYKTSHLYWHTAAHCWDDNSSRSRKYRDGQHRASAPKSRSNPVTVSEARAQALPVDPNGNGVSRATSAKSEVVYPTLVAKQADVAADIYTVQQPITQWPLMLDIDATGPHSDCIQDNGICWQRVETIDAARD